MMAEAATRTSAARKASTTAKSSVIYLAEALRIQCGLHEPWAEAAPAHVRRFRRGVVPTPHHLSLFLLPASTPGA